MKLLFDENLSPRLIQALEVEYPGSVHLRSVGLRGATDEVIWNYAREQGFVIVSKDNDFRQLSFMSLIEGAEGFGARPKALYYLPRQKGGYADNACRCCPCCKGKGPFYMKKQIESPSKLSSSQQIY